VKSKSQVTYICVSIIPLPIESFLARPDKKLKRSIKENIIQKFIAIPIKT